MSKKTTGEKLHLFVDGHYIGWEYGIKGIEKAMFKLEDRIDRLDMRRSPDWYGFYTGELTYGVYAEADCHTHIPTVYRLEQM